MQSFADILKADGFECFEALESCEHANNYRIYASARAYEDAPIEESRRWFKFGDVCQSCLNDFIANTDDLAVFLLENNREVGFVKELSHNVGYWESEDCFITKNNWIEHTKEVSPDEATARTSDPYNGVFVKVVITTYMEYPYYHYEFYHNQVEGSIRMTEEYDESTGIASYPNNDNSGCMIKVQHYAEHLEFTSNLEEDRSGFAEWDDLWSSYQCDGVTLNIPIADLFVSDSKKDMYRKMVGSFTGDVINNSKSYQKDII